MGTYNTPMEEICEVVEAALDTIQGDFTRNTLKQALQNTAIHYSAVCDECGNEQPTPAARKRRTKK